MDAVEVVGVGLALVVYAGCSFWMLQGAVRRDRRWLRWQALLFFLGYVAVPVWLFRRRRWPQTVEISHARRLRLIALSMAIAVVSISVAPISAHFFQVARVEGLAMSQTLNDQDRVIVNKHVFHTGHPAIGDIVMHRYPHDPRKSFVMRVIASGGDEVRIEHGVVFRNGITVDEPYIVNEYRSYDDWGPQLVPEGAYFVMGDHRNNSSDSRHWGFVQRDHILGRVTIRWWPLPEGRSF